MIKEKMLEGFDGTPIYSIFNQSSESRGRILILHGLHDHCGRYVHLSDYFVEQGFSTVRYDMRGYGKSGGMRGYIDRFDDYVKDLDIVLEHYIKESDGPSFLFAHSMGSLVASLHILKYGNPYEGVIFSGGLFKVNEDLSPILQKLSGIMSRIIPRMPTIKLDAKGLSRDTGIEKNIAHDTLHYMGGIRARTGSEILKSTAILQGQLDKLDFPMLILHGGADPLTKCEASELLYEKSQSSDKTLKIYPGAHHELFNEINKKEIFEDIHDWIRERLPQ